MNEYIKDIYRCVLNNDGVIGMYRDRIETRYNICHGRGDGHIVVRAYKMCESGLERVESYEVGWWKGWRSIVWL